MKWMKEDQKLRNKNDEILSFEKYIDKLKDNPTKFIRNSSKYFKEMFDYFGQDNLNHFNLFKTEFENSPSIFGQYSVQQSIYEQLANFTEEGFNNKFTLLVGPNGSCKTSIIKKIMKGAEKYSETAQGSLYTFSWIFPIDNFIKGSLGFNTDSTQTDLQSFAFLEDKDISAILNSELKDHPILLIPKQYRKELFSELFNEDQLDSIKRSYFYTGDLSKRNRLIYDALLKNYKGDHQSVLKHIRIERFNISHRYSSSAVTIEPQLHVDAKLQQITIDKRLASLPPSLQSLNLFSLQGEAIMANRGILEFSDLLKRPLDAFKYLLMTIESKNINIQGVLTELDIIFMGSSNEIHLQAFRQHPDFKSFKGRFTFIKVPYLLNYKEEREIYNDQIEALKGQVKIEPHALETICLFAVMTRLRHCETKNYSDKAMANIATNLTPIEKALFIADNSVPKQIDSEARQVLLQSKSLVEEEHISDQNYEGKFGISPRDIKNILYKLAGKNKSISFLEVIEYLQTFILKREDYDFLKIPPHGNFHNPKKFIDYLIDYSYEIFDQECRESLGIVDDRSYEEYIRKYIEEITAILKNEKVKNKVTGQYENNTYFIKDVEANLDLKESPEKYRSHLLSKMGAYSLDNPGKKIVYTEVFPDISNQLKESFRNEQKKALKTIADNLVFYEDEKSRASLSKDNINLIEKTIGTLQNKYKYSKSSSFNLIKSLIKDRY